MKRIVYEWGLIFTAAMTAALVAVWGLSLFSKSTLFHLHAWPLPESSLHLLVRHGDLWLCDDSEDDSSGDPQATVVGPPFASDYQRGDRLRQFSVPGFTFQYYWLAPWRNYVWSLKVSVLLLAAICMLTAVLLFRRLKLLRRAKIVIQPAEVRVHVLDRP